jgi:hypothetical protein
MYSFSGNCAASVPISTLHVSVSSLYIPWIGPHISCSRIGRSMVGIYKWLTGTWLWPCNSLSGKCLFRIFGVGSLQCRICRLLWAREPARQWRHFVAWLPGQYLIYAFFFKANVIRRIRKEVGRKFRYSKLKGTMPWDFQLLVFFMNQFPPRPWVYQ